MTTLILVLLAVAFAWSMGAHYTGACMGMPHALGTVTAWRALLIMAPLTLLGATFASHAVAHTVGYGLLAKPGLAVPAQIIVIGVAFGLTTAFNRLRIPTSTIQILVFSVSGAAIGAGVGVHWATVGRLAVVWVLAPPAAAVLGYVLTRGLDLVPAIREASVPQALAVGLVVVGGIASFAMGANDVANATGSLVGTHTLAPFTAGLVGGAGLALGVLTWGRPLLTKVAFDIVQVDRPMATAAQLVQGTVVLVAVSFGYFTSMNQALVGGMVGAGAARGRQTVNRSSIVGILRGWFVGPAAGFVAAYLLTLLVAALAGGAVLVAGRS